MVPSHQFLLDGGEDTRPSKCLGLFLGYPLANLLAIVKGGGGDVAQVRLVLYMQKRIMNLHF